jgi:hypothetical protein
LWALAACAFLPLPARAQATVKRADIPGYQPAHVTVNGADDSLPRVSPSGLVVWTGRYNLAGATSVASDNEVFLWDGVTQTQITDDALEQVRPVVNNHGDMAWQVGDGGDFTEMYGQVGGVRTQITSDTVIDRYADINDDAKVIWGRLTGPDYTVSVWDGLVGGAFSLIQPGYRPHITQAGHIHAAGIHGIFDLTGQLVQPMSPPLAYGYRAFRRSEINDLDQLLIEGEPLDSSPGYPDGTGPRHMLFWDGAQLRAIYKSPGPWQGRGDLNSAGILAWEGYGGLPGSRSGTADLEVWVYNPALRQVIQLTDDEQLDSWPTVTEDGRIVWMGGGSYPGVSGNASDREIFIATPTPDADQDGVLDAADLCPLRADPEQADSGGVASAEPDGVGDACQCGDVSNDGRVTATDVELFRTALAAGEVASLPGAGKCRVNGAWARCSVLDVALLRRALTDPSVPTLEHTCDAALQF